MLLLFFVIETYLSGIVCQQSWEMEYCLSLPMETPRYLALTQRWQESLFPLSLILKQKRKKNRVQLL
jgi:hypothetical protein